MRQDSASQEAGTTSKDLPNKLQGRRGDLTWQPSTLLMCPWARHKLPNCSSSGALEKSLTSDLFEEGSKQKEILPVGINKVSHYHLNAADCIFVSLHFSSQNVLGQCVTWPCLLYFLGKGLHTKCRMIKKQSVMPCASHLAIHLVD